MSILASNLESAEHKLNRAVQHQIYTTSRHNRFLSAWEVSCFCFLFYDVLIVIYYISLFSVLLYSVCKVMLYVTVPVKSPPTTFVL